MSWGEFPPGTIVHVHPYAEAATRLLREKGLCGIVSYEDGEPVACVRPCPCKVHGGEPSAPTEPARLRAVIERDRSTVAGALGAVDRVFRSRAWMQEGRGPYEWDDDRYRDEFHRAATDLHAAIEPLRTLARDLTDCPPTQAEVDAARRTPPDSEPPRTEPIYDARGREIGRRLPADENNKILTRLRTDTRAREEETDG